MTLKTAGKVCLQHIKGDFKNMQATRFFEHWSKCTSVTCKMMKPSVYVKKNVCAPCVGKCVGAYLYS